MNFLYWWQSLYNLCAYVPWYILMDTWGNDKCQVKKGILFVNLIFTIDPIINREIVVQSVQPILVHQTTCIGCLFMWAGITIHKHELYSICFQLVHAEEQLIVESHRNVKCSDQNENSMCLINGPHYNNYIFTALYIHNNRNILYPDDWKWS